MRREGIPMIPILVLFWCLFALFLRRRKYGREWVGSTADRGFSSVPFGSCGSRCGSRSDRGGGGRSGGGGGVGHGEDLPLFTWGWERMAHGGSCIPRRTRWENRAPLRAGLHVLPFFCLLQRHGIERSGTTTHNTIRILRGGQDVTKVRVRFHTRIHERHWQRATPCGTATRCVRRWMRTMIQRRRTPWCGGE